MIEIRLGIDPESTTVGELRRFMELISSAPHQARAFKRNEHNDYYDACVELDEARRDGHGTR